MIIIIQELLMVSVLRNRIVKDVSNLRLMAVEIARKETGLARELLKER